MGKTPATCPNCSEKFESRRLYRKHVENKKCETTDEKNKMSTSKVSDDVDMVEDNPQNNIISATVSDMVFNVSQSLQDKEPVSDEEEEDDDDEVQVVKANIFKYQGELTQDQQISQGILHFEYYDDFNDDGEEVIILDDDDLDGDVSLVEEEDEENTLVCCDECGGLFEDKDMEIHKESDHPPKKKSFMQFTGGNFFMLAE